MFYVTGSKIEDVGQKYCIEKKACESYVDCFIRAISFFVEKDPNAKSNAKGRICYKTLRNDLFSQLHISGYFSPTGDKCKDSILSKHFGNNNVTLLEFAVFLTVHTILTDLRTKTELKYSYFPYVIFVLLGFNRSENRQWNGVEEIFKSNSIYFCSKNRENVASLFIRLINNNVLTHSCVQTQDPYIKYLKYHAVLKPGDKSLFDDILYNNHIQWDRNMVYGDLRDLIWRVGIKSTRQYDKLREALLDAATRPYFESLIKDFDREKYALQIARASNNGNYTSIKKGLFRYVVDYQSRSSQIWLQYIKPVCTVSYNDITLTPIYIYSDNFRVDVQNQISWADYVSNGLSYKDSTYSIVSTKSDLYFFEIIEGRLLAEMIEPEQLAGKPCFIVISSSNKNKQNIINYHNAQLFDINQLSVFDNGWEAYYVPKYMPKQAEINMPNNQACNLLKYAQICFDNCITIGRKTYLLDAFPYIVTEGLDPIQDVDIKIDDICGNKVGFKKKVVGNRIYLFDFDQVSSGEVKITIIVDGIAEAHSYRVVSNNQVLPANNKTFAKFDRWGCLNNDLQKFYYSDNEITLSETSSFKITRYMPGYIKVGKQPYHRLMSILYMLGNNTLGQYTFSSKDLDNVINYLAGFEGETLTEKEIRRLKYTLRDLGIITHYYSNDKYVYETNTPRLIPLKEGRSIFNGKQVTDKRDLYLLYGTYSQSIYDNLYNTVDHFEYKSLQLSDKLNKYIPPYIVVGLSSNQNNAPIEKCCTSLVDDLLAFAGKVSELEKDPTVFHMRNCIDEKTYSYPVMVPSPYDRGRRELLRLSANDVLDNDNLSPDLLKTYVRYKKNEPVWFVDRKLQQNSELYFKSEWQLPFYVRKALVAKNSALPIFLYAFGMNGVLGTDKLFYKMYMYECEQQSKMNVLGGIAAQQVEIPSNGLKMYAIKSTENGLDNWHLELFLNGKLLCYTKYDKCIDKVFYDNGNKYIEVVSDKVGYKTINAKLSAILNLHINCIMSKFNANEWIKEYFCLDHNKVSTPSSSVAS